MISEFDLQCSSCSRVEELEERVEELEEKLALKDEKIKRLHKKLRKYRNPHTPSSKKRGSSKSKSSTSGRGKRGRKKGHEGTTRSKAEPEEKIVVEEENCPECGSSSKSLEKLKRKSLKIFPNQNR